MTEQLDKLRSSVGPLQSDIIDAYASGSLSRRGFLVRGSVVGLSTAFMGAVIAACGDDKTATTETTAAGGVETTTPGAVETTVAPDTTPAAGGIKQGGTLRISSQRPGSPLDPVAMDNLGAYTPVVTAFEYLAGPGGGAALAPMLAEEWTPNDDGSKWTFKLRQGVKWHSGADFTSADVVATMDRMVEAGKLSSYMDKGGCAAIDDFTVEFTLKNPDGQFPYNVCHWNPQTVITPKDYATGTTLDAKPDGTGPFKLDSFDVSTGAKFSKNDAWWGGVPYLDGLEFIFSDDLATQITGLQAGDADTCVQISVLDGQAIINNPDQFTVEAIRGAAHRQIWMNVREGNFTDVNVRTAIALGLDRQALVDTCLGGKGDVGNDHPIAPVYEFFDSGLAQRERDVEKAKQLLADAGKAGLAITMHAPKLQEIPQLAELVQTQLKEIGLDITLNVESTDTFYDEWCKVYDSTNEPAGCDGGQEFGIVDYGNRGVPDVYLVKAYATGEWNSAHYNSADFNQAVKDYQAALTLDARKEPVSRIQKIANTDVPYAIPYFYNSLFAYANTVTGILATGLGHFYCGTAGFKA